MPIPARSPLPPPERVSVHVVLDRRQLEDLELLVRYRHGERHSRSAVIRRAVGWYLAKEAVWLVRQRRAEAARQARAAELERARRLPREDRGASDRADLVRRAVDLAREAHRDG